MIFSETVFVLGLLLPLPLQLAGNQDESAQSETKAERAGTAAVVETFSAELAGGAGGIEVDREGFVYCADFGSRLGAGGTGGHRIYKLGPDGSAELYATSLRGASGNAIGPDGMFYQSNIGSNTISRIDEKGVATVFASQNLSSPVGIIIDEQGTLFVANCNSNSIAKIDRNGTSAIFAKDPLLKCPNGITLDPEHILYVCNFSSGDVLRVSWTGEVTKLATLPGNNNGHLLYHEGYLYVVARSAHQIYRVSLEGEVELFAGSGQRGHANGPALEASFSYPNDIAVSPDGKFFYINENASITAAHTELAPMLVRRIRIAE